MMKAAFVKITPTQESQLIRLRRALLILWLHAKHLLTGCRLQLLVISDQVPVIISGESISICWEVKGCHRITINDSLILAGTARLIRFNPERLAYPLVIRFHGCRHNLVKVFAAPPVQLKAKPLSFIKNQSLPVLNARLDSLSAVNGGITLRQAPFSNLRFYTLSENSVAIGPQLHIQLDNCVLPEINP